MPSGLKEVVVILLTISGSNKDLCITLDIIDAMTAVVRFCEYLIIDLLHFGYSTTFVT